MIVGYRSACIYLEIPLAEGVKIGRATMPLSPMRAVDRKAIDTALHTNEQWAGGIIISSIVSVIHPGRCCVHG